jgi:hypothetical protein
MEMRKTLLRQTQKERERESDTQMRRGTQMKRQLGMQ